MKLTEIRCKNEKPTDKPKKVADGLGLYLEVMPNGSKYWRFKYRYLRKEKRLAIGVYPEISLKEARLKRDEARQALKENRDPSFEKQKRKRAIFKEHSDTFEKIAREWHEHKKIEWKEEHADRLLQRLEKDVFPVIGQMPIKYISHQELLNVAQEVQQRGANELAKRIIQMSCHIFQYAIITGRTDKNIATDLKGLIKPKPKKHFASIELQELPEFIKVLNSNQARLMPLTQYAVQFMMLTFVRTNEMIKAEWSEFDFNEKIWLIPGDRMKMKKDHLVPLSSQAIQILKKIREIHKNQKYVFPSRDNSRKHMSNNTILMALRRMGYAGKMTGHGFRSLAMSAIMEKLGYRFEVPDRQLAHSKRGDVNKAYDRAMFLDERKVMMQDWSDYLDSLN